MRSGDVLRCFLERLEYDNKEVRFILGLGQGEFNIMAMGCFEIF